MANKMLVDATHPEETRVVVLRGNRVQEFDFESASRRQLRGNIYLAKVTRVEPSLQAAFVDYGGNRHGFLAFSEIHPDYYQIPVADRQALIDAEREDISDGDERSGESASSDRRGRAADQAAAADAGEQPTVSEPAPLVGVTAGNVTLPPTGVAIAPVESKLKGCAVPTGAASKVMSTFQVPGPVFEKK